jgi:hypothetical protein
MSNDVHTIAERFLKELKRGNTRASFYAPADNPDITTLADSITDRVVVQREEAPQYFVGFKPSGRPVWSHDVRLAASYDSASLSLVRVLGTLKAYAMEVETMPATWFSNHQYESSSKGSAD